MGDPYAGMIIDGGRLDVIEAVLRERQVLDGATDEKLRIENPEPEVVATDPCDGEEARVGLDAFAAEAHRRAVRLRAVAILRGELRDVVDAVRVQRRAACDVHEAIGRAAERVTEWIVNEIERAGR